MQSCSVAHLPFDLGWKRLYMPASSAKHSTIFRSVFATPCLSLALEAACHKNGDQNPDPRTCVDMNPGIFSHHSLADMA